MTGLLVSICFNVPPPSPSRFILTVLLVDPMNPPWWPLLPRRTGRHSSHRRGSLWHPGNSEERMRRSKGKPSLGNTWEDHECPRIWKHKLWFVKSVSLKTWWRQPWFLGWLMCAMRLCVFEDINGNQPSELEQKIIQHHGPQTTLVNWICVKTWDMGNHPYHLIWGLQGRTILIHTHVRTHFTSKIVGVIMLNQNLIAKILPCFFCWSISTFLVAYIPIRCGRFSVLQLYNRSVSPLPRNIVSRRTSASNRAHIRESLGSYAQCRIVCAWLKKLAGVFGFVWK
jgi:hypothetical protein